MTNTACLTPREIDEQLADLHRRAGSADQNVTVARITIRRAIGQRETGYGVHRTWPTTDAEAIANARTKAAAGESASISYSGRPIADFVDRYDEAVAALAAIEAQAAPLNAEFIRRGGWPRFFIVSGGHIHSSMNCSTCNRGSYATQFGWNPELSGLSEADAVAKLGPSLCTVCFPSAPVEWTVGKPSNHCAGTTPVDGSVRQFARSAYGECPTCGERFPVTMSGLLRKHKATK